MMWRSEGVAESRVVKVCVVVGFAALYALLYARGLDFGRPMHEHSDEWAITEQGMNMAAAGPLAPLRKYTYGSLNIFIQSGVSSLLHAYNNAHGVYRDADNMPIRKHIEKIAADPRDRDQFQFYLAARITTACYAAVLFCIVYLLAKRLFGSRPIACLCVLAVMLNPLIVQQAHFALPNIPATLLALASVYCSLAFLDNGRLRVLYLGAVIAGLAVGAKITMVWAFAAVAAAAWIRLRTGGIKHLPFLTIAFILAFLIAEPFVVTDARRYFADLAAEGRMYGKGGIVDSRDLQPAAFGSEAMRQFSAKWRLPTPFVYWAHQGAGWFLLSLVGIVLLPFKKGWRGALALVFPLLAYLFIGVQGKVVTTNYVPLIPFGALGLGATAQALLQWRDNRGSPSRFTLTAALVLVIAAALAWPARSSVGVIQQFTSKDPYQTALEWIETHIPKEAKIAVDQGLPAVIPFTNEGRPVKLDYLMFFWKPYTCFLDQDYVVTLTAGLYDRFPWYHPMVAFWKPDPLLLETFVRNRQLNEKHLILLRRITPEECGYVPWAEMPTITHDVSIYQVPKTTPIRLLPDSPTIPGTRDWNVENGKAVVAQTQLKAGRYDVFLNATKRHGNPSGHTFLSVRINDQIPCKVHIIEAGGYDYFVCTTDVSTPRPIVFRIEIYNTSSDGGDVVSIHNVVCVPTTGEAIPGVPL